MQLTVDGGNSRNYSMALALFTNFLAFSLRIEQPAFGKRKVEIVPRLCREL